MHLAVLGSSSSGNCTVIWNSTSSLLVDCGFPVSVIARALEGLGSRIPPLAAVLITHVHSDHVNPLTLAHYLERDVPAVVSKRVSRILARRHPFMRRALKRNLLIEAAATGVETGGFEVTGFPVPHDAPGGCSGFAIRSGSGRTRKRIVIATDLGYVEDGLVERFTDAHAIVIESNHDSVMLETSSRPPWLKKRIREIGHLSNDQSAEFVAAVMKRSVTPPHTVVLAHISQECNTRSLAVETMRQRLHSDGYTRTSVVPTHQDRASDVIAV